MIFVYLCNLILNLLNMRQKSFIIAIIVVAVLLLLEFFPMPYTYSNDAAAKYVRTHAENRSAGLCARYVRLAIEGGGCPWFSMACL